MSRTTRLLTLAAAVAVALAGTACSGETGKTDGSGAAESVRSEAASDRGVTARLATVQFRVDGMTCGGCALATELAVKKLEGVRSADAEYDKATGEGRCTVEYDPKAVSVDRIAAAIERAGFRPTLESADESG